MLFCSKQQTKIKQTTKAYTELCRKRAKKLVTFSEEQTQTETQQPQERRRKSYREIQQDIDAIGRMLAAGAVDREIMEKLKLKKTQYYAYRAKLYKESAQQFDRTTDDELVHQKEILQERFVRLFRRLELDLNQADVNNPTRPQLYLAGQQIATNIFKVHYEGLKALSRHGNNLNVNGYLRRVIPGEFDQQQHKVGSLPRYTEERSGTPTVIREERNTSNKNPIPDESEVY